MPLGEDLGEEMENLIIPDKKRGKISITFTVFMKKFTFKEHFLELKARIRKIFIFLIISFVFCYYFSDIIYIILLRPLVYNGPDSIDKIIYTGLTEAFFTYLKLSAFVAFLLNFPMICYQFYAFIAPGLLPDEKKIILAILFLSPILFFSGSFFVFYLVMPKAWNFFLSFENSKIGVPLVLEAKISEYFSLVMQLILAFGLAFQVPVVMIILNIMGFISSETLRRKRRISIVINFILAAIFTPPDVLSQIALAIPLLLLYEISILICKFIENRGTKNA